MRLKIKRRFQQSIRREKFTFLEVKKEGNTSIRAFPNNIKQLEKKEKKRKRKKRVTQTFENSINMESDTNKLKEIKEQRRCCKNADGLFATSSFLTPKEIM